MHDDPFRLEDAPETPRKPSPPDGNGHAPATPPADRRPPPSRREGGEGGVDERAPGGRDRRRGFGRYARGDREDLRVDKLRGPFRGGVPGQSDGRRGGEEEGGLKYRTPGRRNG